MSESAQNGKRRQGAAFPPWLAGYRAAYLPLDVVAGVTLVAIAVPEQLATAHLAGMPVVAGLYAFLAAVAMFALLGANRTMSVGADSTIAPMLAAAVAALAVTGSSRYGADMALLSLLVGALIVAVGVARMGWIADFLSAPVVTGFLAGIAVTIVVGQLAEVLGLPSTRGNTLQKLAGVARHLSDANLYALAVAVVVFAVIVACERVSRRLPGALIGVLLSLAASAAFDLAARGVVTMGALPAGLPTLHAPPFSAHLVWRLLPSALAVALIVITQTAATTRSFAELGGFETSVDRDFIGVGAGGVLAALIGGFAVNASPPRTAVATSSGARSQVPGLVAAALVVVLIVAAAGALADLPLATLGAVLIYVALRIFRVGELRAIYRFDKAEFGVALATLGTVVVFGVGPGVLLAILLSILYRTWRSSRPRDALLGRLPGTTVWWARQERTDAQLVPGVVAYRFDAPLYFANAARFRDRVRELVAAAPSTACLFVLDASGIEDVDYTGGRMLLQVVHELHAGGVDFAVARATGEAPLDTARAGLRRHIGDDHLFLTVDDAVRALGPRDGAAGPLASGPGSSQPRSSGPGGRASEPGTAAPDPGAAGE
jgi:high affinity sulfate transporter 1